MSGSDTLLVEKNGSIVRLRLNRPQAGNAIDLELAQALYEAAVDCDLDDRVRCVVISGSGRMFCVGGDVRKLHAAGAQLPSLLEQITGPLHAAYARLARMAKPVITAIHGPAAGAGVGLACIGDIALAASTASFTLAYSALGLSPDGGATWLLPRLIGLRRTQELYLTNQRVAAAEAARIGLVTRVVDDADLGAQVQDLAATLAGSAVGAVGRTKRLLLDGDGLDLDAQLNAEASAIVAQGASQEAGDGVSAFIERRRPCFS